MVRASSHTSQMVCNGSIYLALFQKKQPVCSQGIALHCRSLHVPVHCAPWGWVSRSEHAQRVKKSEQEFSSPC